MEDLLALEKNLGIEFNDYSLLSRSLTHRSFLNENPHQALEDNERLEFLGDAVLDFVVEYPLAWEKERRLNYGSKEGEVLWTHPEHPDTTVLIGSYTSGDLLFGTEYQITQTLKKYVGLEVSTKTKTAIAAGDAWHITGHGKLFFHY